MLRFIAGFYARKDRQVLLTELILINPPGSDGPKPPKDKKPSMPAEGEPGWADGLRQLYNSVLNEPLPTSFDDLLRKLDKGDNA